MTLSLGRYINEVYCIVLYCTKIVEVNLNRGDKIHKIEAICVPKFNINLKLPNLNIIVREFVNKGYELVDKFLNNFEDNISNIKFLLGTKSLYCLRTTQESFGFDGKYMFAKSNLGVILLGDINTMITDLPSLPAVHDITTHVSSLKSKISDKVNDNCNIENLVTDNLNYIFNSSGKTPDNFNINLNDELQFSEIKNFLSNSKMNTISNLMIKIFMMMFPVMLIKINYICIRKYCQIR